ncbi:TPA: hypothetical protein ACHB2C_002507 [Klebsiella variicola subsp. variicola]
MPLWKCWPANTYNSRQAAGDFVLIRYDGMTDFGRLMGQAFITRDGEALEGEALDDVTVIGVVTFTICDVRQDNEVV